MGSRARACSAQEAAEVLRTVPGVIACPLCRPDSALGLLEHSRGPGPLQAPPERPWAAPAPRHGRPRKRSTGRAGRAMMSLLTRLAASAGPDFLETAGADRPDAQVEGPLGKVDTMVLETADAFDDERWVA